MSTSGIDVTKPNIARVFDVLLGGRDNYAADREAAERLVQACPDLPGLAAANRAFLGQAVTWAPGQGADQFIDLGCGIPRPAGVQRPRRGQGGEPGRAGRLRRP